MTRAVAAPVGFARAASAPRWRVAVAGAAVLGLALGFLATPAAEQAEAVRVAGPELTRLLRMMAGLKMAFFAAGLAFAWWRVGHPIRPAPAAGYLAAITAVAVSPGLIWGMAHVGLGAVLLHGGLVALVALGCFDRDLRGPVMSGLLRRRTPSSLQDTSPL